MDEIYTKHAEALRAAKLAPEVLPNMGEVLDGTTDTTTEGEEKTPNKRGMCGAYHLLLGCASSGKCQSMSDLRSYTTSMV